MVAASRLTEESIGSGDGWFILASAGYMETEEMLILLLGGFGISWIVSMGIILGRSELRSLCWHVCGRQVCGF